jgi:hypothetical protein
VKTMEVEPTYTVRSEPSMVQWPKNACCCTAPPVVRVVMPATGDRSHSVELFLCGHHYRTSRSTLAEAGASTAFRDPTLAVWWANSTGR